MDESSTMSTLPLTQSFTHQAMNTDFHLRIANRDPAIVAGMAKECFDHLDFIESRLSRYIDDSDVSRINQMKGGETLYVSECTHQCLLAAIDAHSRTSGLFDITLGRLIEHRKTSAEDPPPLLCGQITIHPDIPAVTCNAPGRVVDLGGIGKGFALDQMKQILIEWGADGALLMAGASSLLAFGHESWPIELSYFKNSLTLQLSNEALSASGTDFQGHHIIHPRGDDAMPHDLIRRVWVTAPTATLAEIWSTALMLLEPANLADFVGDDDTITRIYCDQEGNVVSIPLR
jgi:FAD:protein FMN transferase